MMTRPASSCRSLYQLQDRRAIAIILMLLLSVVSVDAAYRGVATRDDGVSFYCEVSFVGVSPRVKVWVGTYPTQELAALACDVAFFYTNRPPKLEYSEDLIRQNCKPRSAYDSLNGWEERKKFIRAEANALINLMSSEDHAPNLRWADVIVPPLDPVRQRTGDIACTLVEHFCNQTDRLREFMAWLMRLSIAATQSTLTGHVQTSSQLDTEEPLPVEVDQFLDAARARFLLESVEVRPGGALWLTLITRSLPLLLQIFTIQNAHDVKGATINANDPTFSQQERCESRAECSTKRQKAKHPSTELVPDQEDLLTAIHVDVKDEAWQCTGYGLLSKTWRTLPPVSFGPDAVPAPDSVCGHGSLMCANVSATGAELVVFNPLTGKKRPLPPLQFPRHPVLIQILVDSARKSYKVIAAGSSSPGEGHLSKKMEVFDSRTSQWEETCDIPGPEFALNDYQTGVCANGKLYFILCLEGGGGKGVVVFDVENGKWLPNMTCPIPYSSSANMSQLVENNGVVYHFSNLVGEEYYTRCIDVLELSDPKAGEVTCQWRNKIHMNYRRRPQEFLRKSMCVGFGEDKLCIFDNLGTGGEVYDMRCGSLAEILKQGPRDPDLHRLFTKIPASFNLQLSPDSDPFPSSVDDIQKAVPLIVHPYL